MNTAFVPPEVLGKIAFNLDTKNLQSFCLASRQLYRIGIQFVYAHVCEVSKLGGRLSDDSWRQAGKAIPVCKAAGCSSCSYCCKGNRYLGSAKCSLCFSFRHFQNHVLVHNLPVQRGLDRLLQKLNLMSTVVLHFSCETGANLGVVHMSRLLAALGAQPSSTVFTKARSVDIHFLEPHATIATTALKLFVKHPRVGMIKIRSDRDLPRKITSLLLKILGEDGRDHIYLHLDPLPGPSESFWKLWGTFRCIQRFDARIKLDHASSNFLRATYSNISQLPCLGYLNLRMEWSKQAFLPPETPYVFPSLVNLEIESECQHLMLDTLKMISCPKLNTMMLLVGHPPFLDSFSNIVSAALLCSPTVLEQIFFHCEYDLQGELDPGDLISVMQVDDTSLAPLLQMKNLTSLDLDPELRFDAITDRFLADLAATLPALTSFIVGVNSLYRVAPCATVSGVQAVLNGCRRLETFHMPFKLEGVLVLQEVLLSLTKFGSMCIGPEPQAVLFHIELISMRPGLENVTVGYYQNLRAVTPRQKHLASDAEEDGYSRDYHGCRQAQQLRPLGRYRYFEYLNPVLFFQHSCRLCQKFSIKAVASLRHSLFYAGIPEHLGAPESAAVKKND
ncbi:hypothetical protein CPB83DRAFT_841192 [Crepidotus variabilis]|uniref:F-box domain-containing protein n=1 Tax=Crepidotus variabilis TaxID=179855 RepID=A0A9P6E2X6_9AGAR|nr:hypothetical protein CPB83DRAFT_841192 [Crepidotus variabilis]